jgi:hypothetical protein
MSPAPTTLIQNLKRGYPSVPPARKAGTAIPVSRFSAPCGDSELFAKIPGKRDDASGLNPTLKRIFGKIIL